MSVTVELKRTGLDKLLSQMLPECDALVRRTALAIEGDAKQRAPIKTGFLRSSIQMHDPRVGDAEAEVIVGAEYGILVERGSQPHTIEPKSKKALYWKGATSPVRRVSHPGTKAKPFLEPAVDAQRGPFESELARLVKQLGE